MALVLKDRVKETTTTTGTGTLTLLGAATGYQAFSSIGNGNTCYYAISSTGGAEWEVGIGTYSSNTLSRDTILSSSAAGAAVSLSAGTKDVYVVYPAEKAIYEEANGTTLINAGPITVVGSNVTSYTSFTAALGEYYGNVDNYAQLYVQNLNGGTEASADFAAYNDQSDGETFFVDMGISSSGSSSNVYPILGPNSGYVISYGDGASNTSNLLLGSGDANVKIFAGSFDSNSTVATFGTDLSTTLEGALDVGSTLNVSGVTTLNALAYTSGNIAAAANNTVLVTKQYVDDATSNGFHVHTPVLVATTANLTATYNNGTLGVGATLTNSGTQAALSIDGVAMSVNDRVLVWQQTTGTQNGVYVVTTVGSGSTNWVLTRSSDANTSSEGDPNSLGGGDYFFVQSGDTLGYHSYICTNTDVIVFGTTAITFSEFSSIPAYTGGTNINVDGQVISITGTVGPTNGGTGVNTVTTGDVLYGSGTNTWGKLAKGAAYKSLVMDGSGTNIEWNAVALNQSAAVSGSLGATNGGTGQSGYTLGDTLYSSATNTLSKLSGNTTTTKKFLGQTGTGSASQAPVWEQPAATDITGLAPSATTDTTNASNITSGTLANARTTASATNGASTIVARDASGNFAAAGITATTFSGSGASLTSLNATAISSGTIGNAYTTASSSNGASTIVARDSSGNFAAATITATTFSGAHSGSGSGLTNLNASAITTGTIGNAYTTATTSNGASTIVSRDASGNFAANTITASLSGNASTATTLQTARTIGIGTGATGTATSFNGSAAITIPITDVNASYLGSGTVPAARVSGSYTGITGVGTLTAGTWNASAISDTYLSTISTAGKVSNSATTATSSNGASTIVARDASGNFSAGTITATLNGNASTATSATSATSATTATTATNQSGGTVSATTGAFSGAVTQSGNSYTTYGPNTSWGAYLRVGGNGRTVSGNAYASVAATDGNLHLDAGDAKAMYLNYYAGTGGINFGNGASGVVGSMSAAGALTMASFSGSGASLTSLNASNLSSGTVATARLGSGTASSSTYLRGDGTWAAVSVSPAGSTTQVQYNNAGSFGASSSFTFTSGSGTVTATVFSASSDARDKKDWGDVDSDFVAKLANVKHGTYTRISTENREIGVSAQSLVDVMKEAVIADESGNLSVNYGNAALVAAVKLAQEVVELRKEIELLKAR